MNIISRLLRTTVGSCTCITKTPDIQYHSVRCTYRVLMEAVLEIEQLQIEVDMLREVSSMKQNKEV